MINSDLPFGGVGGSGYGRYHGKAGFEECCNKKSVLVKDALTMWPFNKVMPPYTSDKKQFITFLATKLDYTQSQLAKRLFWVIVLIWLVWLVVTKRLTAKKLRKWKAMAGMAWQMMSQ